MSHRKVSSLPKGSGSRSYLGVRRDSSINQGGRGIRNSGVSARSLLRIQAFRMQKKKEKENEVKGKTWSRRERECAG